MVRTGTVIYGRAEMPDDFAYTVARAMDEQQRLLQWRHLNFSYNIHPAWKAYEVPLHPGAARHYRKMGYIKYPFGAEIKRLPERPNRARSVALRSSSFGPSSS